MHRGDRIPHEFFRTQVFPDEIEEIKTRRAAVGIQTGDLIDVPTAENGLTGLAISGGGVRSASFALGAVQTLARLGILERVDYLSTVSGGGFLGSCVSALLHAEASNAAGEGFPLAHPAGQPEPPALAHVRSYCGYLAPEGLLDKLRIPALVVRGVLVNVFTVFAMLLIAVVVTESVHDLPWTDAMSRVLLIGGAFLGFVLFVTLSIVEPALMSVLRKRVKWPVRDATSRLLTRLFVLGWTCAALVPVAGLTLRSVETDSQDAVRDGASMVEWVITNARSEQFLLAAAIGAAVLLFAGWLLRPMASVLGRLALYPIGMLGPLSIYGAYLLLCLYAIQDDRHVVRSDALQLDTMQLLGTIGVVILGFVAWLYDVNLTSIHGFYRDRLSRAWLITHKVRGKEWPWPHHVDDLKLSELAGEGSPAPYHLLQAAVNTSVNDPRLHGRTADFFTFSKRWIGGPQIGYARTETLERLDNHLNLGTALAISGAAAAPQMGTATIRPLTFLLALLNVRMGYWMANPRFAEEPGTLGRLLLWRGPGLLYLVREALGVLDFEHTHVYLSDGGHVENLGIYELIRRKCRHVVAIDAEEDGPIHCPSLLELVRFARMDLGIEIEIDIKPLKPDLNGYSERHWVRGKIHYGPGEVGTLLYIKASITGDESADLLDYRRRSPAFPHDSTADQFFDPPRFEAYRALGARATAEAVHGIGGDPFRDELLSS